jgi:hypothetical protein
MTRKTTRRTARKSLVIPFPRANANRVQKMAQWKSQKAVIPGVSASTTEERTRAKIVGVRLFVFTADESGIARNAGE